MSSAVPLRRRTPTGTALARSASASVPRTAGAGLRRPYASRRARRESPDSAKRVGRSAAPPGGTGGPKRSLSVLRVSGSGDSDTTNLRCSARVSGPRRRTRGAARPRRSPDRRSPTSRKPSVADRVGVRRLVRRGSPHPAEERGVLRDPAVSLTAGSHLISALATRGLVVPQCRRRPGRAAAELSLRRNAPSTTLAVAAEPLPLGVQHKNPVQPAFASHQSLP